MKTDKVKLEPGDIVLTNEIVSINDPDGFSRATISKIHGDRILVCYGFHADFTEVSESSCIFLKRPKDPYIPTPKEGMYS